MSYEILDSGDGRKLERIGDFRVDRQAPQALWKRRLPASEWARVDGKHVRSEKGGGHWQWKRTPPESFDIEFGGLRLEIKPTPFGHVGFFAEQAAQWQWLRATVESLKASGIEKPRLLNLFAYTGGSSLSPAQAGAAVTHVDAAHGIVDWARSNARLNRMESAEIRWIVDDCRRFVEREVRREAKYDGIILDPPSFGRGAKQEIWKIEDDLPPLLDLSTRLTGKSPKCLLFSCHTEGYTPSALPRILGDHFRLDDRAESGEMTATEADGRLIPSGFFLRFCAG